VQSAAGGDTFDSQVSRRVNIDTALVILVGGTNDAQSLSALPDGVTHTLEHVHATAPNAKVIVVGPAWVGAGSPPDAIGAVIAAISRAAEQSGAQFIDALAEGWIAGHEELLAPNGLQLNDAGQKEFGVRLVGAVHAALSPPTEALTPPS
jgi:hypothetical protein